MRARKKCISDNKPRTTTKKENSNRMRVHCRVVGNFHGKKSIERLILSNVLSGLMETCRFGIDEEMENPKMGISMKKNERRGIYAPVGRRTTS